MRIIVTAILTLFYSAGVWTVTAQASDSTPCKALDRPESRYIICQFDLSHNSLRLLWRDPKGEAYGSLRNIAAAATPETGKMLMAMNAGMYHKDLTPVGLYIEKGRPYVPLSTRAGPGNFHMRPNGVFYLMGKTAGVVETSRYSARAIKPDYATQSGPMLVIDGKLHPRFSPTGDSRKIRNGVGVRDGKQVFFVISDSPVTFSQFAMLFRDTLKTPNALYLDGSISSIYAPSVGRADGFMPVGPIIAGFEK